MIEKPEVSEHRDAWVERELSKLLPVITEESWNEVWAVIGPKAA
ncbi:hypothetical protein ACFYO2_26435 [Streptomyces sp. NPDC006602]